jgi:hypothetical protein
METKKWFKCTAHALDNAGILGVGFGETAGQAEQNIAAELGHQKFQAVITEVERPRGTHRVLTAVPVIEE